MSLLMYLVSALDSHLYESSRSMVGWIEGLFGALKRNESEKREGMIPAKQNELSIDSKL